MKRAAAAYLQDKDMTSLGITATRSWLYPRTRPDGMNCALSIC